MSIGDIGGFYDADGVLVGSAVGFYAPVGTDDPADSIEVFDPAIWVDPWLSAGATEQGWQLNWTPQTQNISIDEQPTPVGVQLQSAVLEFVANLSEDSIASWGIALNADAVVTAATSSVFGKTVSTPNPVLKEYYVVLETQSENDFPVRYLVPKCVAIGNVGAQFQRAGTQRLIPVTFTSTCAFTDIRRVEITANKT